MKKSEDHLALQPSPSKLFVETTTRCNLRCRMCVKYAEGSSIDEADMAPETFERLAPLFPSLDTLILSGIGEPLLHPHLVEFVRLARRSMPQGSAIGFQSNGLLLTEDLARELIEAGLSTICLSVDTVSPKHLEDIRVGAKTGDIDTAFAALRTARAAVDPGFRIGVEMVAMLDTLNDLPETIRYAAGQGADYALITHMLAYHDSQAHQAAFDCNADKSMAFFNDKRRQAADLGLQLENYRDLHSGKALTEEESKLRDFATAFFKEARELGVPINFKQLAAADQTRIEGTERAFEAARKAAEEEGLGLALPSVSPKADRRCDFLEDGGMFVTQDGDVHACYYLWHRYDCSLQGRRKPVRAESYGNVRDADPAAIWNDEAYRSFRSQALRYEYANCSNCGYSPCNLIDNETFDHDCYGYETQCCDCPWCEGLLQCLR